MPNSTEELTPFRIDVPEADLADLRARLANIRLPDPLPGDDWATGVPVSYLRSLADNWRQLDWRAVERRLNELPQFTTLIDGQTIHAIHVASPVEGALPLLLTHGWPGSFLEFVDLIGPLTDPASHGGDPVDAFSVVIPSLPGFGFSSPLVEGDWGLGRIARAWVELMSRLGYHRFAVQGGDLGAQVSPEVARVAPDRVVGVHINGAFGGWIDGSDEAATAGMTDLERDRMRRVSEYMQAESGYYTIQGTRPGLIGNCCRIRRSRNWPGSSTSSSHGPGRPKRTRRTCSGWTSCWRMRRCTGSRRQRDRRPWSGTHSREFGARCPRTPGCPPPRSSSRTTSESDARPSSRTPSCAGPTSRAAADTSPRWRSPRCWSTTCARFCGPCVRGFLRVPLYLPIVQEVSCRPTSPPSTRIRDDADRFVLSSSRRGRASDARRARGAPARTAAGHGSPRVHAGAGVPREARRPRGRTRRHPDSRRCAPPAVHDQRGPAAELSVRHVRGADVRGRSHPRLVGNDRSPHGGRLHARRPQGLVVADRPLPARIRSPPWA